MQRGTIKETIMEFNHCCWHGVACHLSLATLIQLNRTLKADVSVCYDSGTSAKVLFQTKLNNLFLFQAFN